MADRQAETAAPVDATKPPVVSRSKKSIGRRAFRRKKIRRSSARKREPAATKRDRNAG
jgi:hypothetical protein